MKISFLIPLLFIGTVFAQSTDEDDEYGQSFRFVRRRSLGGDIEEWTEIQSDSGTSGCITVKNNEVYKYQKLIFGNCNAPGWRLDIESSNEEGDDGMFRTELDPSYCMQAGKNGKVKDGEFVRLVKCDSSKRLQKFRYINGGGIRPLSNLDYCMVWRGVNGNVGIDPIIFKKCDEVVDRVQWSGV